MHTKHESKCVLEVDLTTYRRLQNLASPLEDTPTTVLKRLLDFYEQAHKPLKSEEPSLCFVTDLGERLPIGLVLHARYKNEVIAALVHENWIEADGRKYYNPTAAAVAVKMKRGADKRSAQSNGWLFWRYKNASDRWVVLDKLRVKRTS